MVTERSGLVLRGLYAITPDEANTSRLVVRVTSVLTAKPALLQYRNKSASPALQEEQAKVLAELCREVGVPLVINDNASLALRVGAAGVHLGAEDGALDDARLTLGPSAIIGVSCYGSVMLAEKSARDGATYVAFGSVFASPTKPSAVQITLSLLEEARRRIRIPICAIGGIERCNAAKLIALGVDLVAVISDVFDDPQPAMAAKQFGSLFLRS